MGYFRLAVHHDSFPPRKSGKVNAMAFSGKGDVRSFMDLAFPVHAISYPGCAQHIGEPLLQYTGTDPSKYILPAFAFQYDGTNSF